MIAVSSAGGSAAAAGFLILFFIAAWVCIGGLIGWAIAKNKGRGVAGFWLGALLGWIGWIIAAILSPSPEADAKRIATTQAHLAAIAPQYRPGPPPMSSGGVPAGWHPDPRGRFDVRYWDGGRWTEHVSRAGHQSIDPL